MSVATVGEMQIKLSFDGKEVETTMTSIAAASESSAGKSASVWEKAGNAIISNVAIKAFNAVTQSVSDFAAGVISAGSDFSATMSKVSALTGATGNDFTALSDKAKELGANTKYSATEVADAMTFMGMAGWKTSDIVGGLAGILDLATASGSDLATTSDIVTDALTAFGLSASDSGRLADVMAAASSNANTNVQMMGETFKYAAPIAGALGYSIEDTAVAIGLMANSGIKASQAGTSLRSMLTRMADPPKEAAAAMEALGVSITNADGSMKPFSSVIGQLRSAFANLNPEQQASYASALAGTEAMSGLLAIVNASPADFDKLTNAVDQSEGAAAQMAATMSDNLEGDIASTNSKVEALQLKIYSGLEPALRAGEKALGGMADAMSWLIDNGGMVVGVLGSLAAGVIAYQIATNGAAIVTGIMTTVTNVMTAAQTALNIAMSLNPIGLIIAAIVIVIGLIIALWTNCEWFRDLVFGMFEALGSFFGMIGEWIGGIIDVVAAWLGGVAGTVGGVFSAIGAFIGAVVNGIIGFFVGLWETVAAIFSAVGSFLAAVFAVPITIITAVIEMIAKIGEIIMVVIYTIVALAVQFFIGLFQTVWDFLSAGITAVGEWFTMLWTGLMTALTAVGEFFANIFNAVWTAVSGVVDKIKNAFQVAWNFLTGIFGKVGAWFGEQFQKAYTAVTTAFNNVIQFFQGVWNTIVNLFTSIGTTVGNAVKNALATAINFVLQAIETVVNAGIDFINTLIDGVNAISGLVGITISKLNHISLGRVAFAEGGIVPGNNYSGDKIPAAVNSGEMVITRAQQAALWDAIESGNYGRAAMPEPMTAAIDNLAVAIGDAFGDDVGVSDGGGRPINVTMYNDIDNELDADAVGDLMLESIRMAMA